MSTLHQTWGNKGFQPGTVGVSPTYWYDFTEGYSPAKSLDGSGDGTILDITGNSRSGGIYNVANRYNPHLKYGTYNLSNPNGNENSVIIGYGMNPHTTLFSFSLGFKINSLKTGLPVVIIGANQDVANENWWFGYYYNGSAYRWYSHHADATVEWISSSVSPTANVWYIISQTWNATSYATNINAMFNDYGFGAVMNPSYHQWGISGATAISRTGTSMMANLYMADITLGHFFFLSGASIIDTTTLYNLYKYKYGATNFL